MESPCLRIKGGVRQSERRTQSVTEACDRARLSRQGASAQRDDGAVGKKPRATESVLREVEQLANSDCLGRKLGTVQLVDGDDAARNQMREDRAQAISRWLIQLHVEVRECDYRLGVLLQVLADGPARVALDELVLLNVSRHV